MSTTYRPPNMVRGRPVMLAVIGLIAFGCIMAFVVAFYLKKIIRQLPPPITSPNGAYVANLAVNEQDTDRAAYMRLAVDIRDAKTKGLLFHRQTTASALRFYDLKWTDDETLTLDSAEVGFELHWTHAGPTWTDDPHNGEYVIPAVPTTSPATRP